MNDKIWKVISKLGEQANKERRGEVMVLPEDRMLAITAGTGMFFNIMLKAIQAGRILEIGTSTGYSTLWFADAVKQNNHNKTETEKPIILKKSDESLDSYCRSLCQKFLSTFKTEMFLMRIYGIPSVVYVLCPAIRAVKANFCFRTLFYSRSLFHTSFILME